MSVDLIGFPADVRRRLEYRLFPLRGVTPVLRVTPRDTRERKSPVHAADHYQVQAFYLLATEDWLDPLHDALAAAPGVYLTTQVQMTREVRFTNPAWPAVLGERRRDRLLLRTQVMALIRDPEGKSCG